MSDHNRQTNPLLLIIVILLCLSSGFFLRQSSYDPDYFTKESVTSRKSDKASPAKDSKEKNTTQKKEKKKSKAVIPENQELKSIIAPIGITFNRINAVIGDNLARCYGVIRYPQFAEYGWLRRLTNIHGTVAAIHFTPLNTDEVLKSLNNNIRNYRMDANDGKKDELERQRAEQSIRNAEEAMRRIDQNGEVVGRMCFVLCRLQKMKNHSIRFVRMSKMLRRLQTVNVESWRVNKRKASSSYFRPIPKKITSIGRQGG